ncbi:ArsR/SmtB family transcription factor [Tenacibaculum agarivorans]|uniref:ArsR/SmtB family transcription factor n=1 Tax=Tenacibaculum agarivorans TaxID=1908389 RepID=UPI00094B8A8E|nr:helix-turn-helix transcriptional regulator [Tenacibaculum agarivorans]
MENLEHDFSEIAALLGDKSRAIMLWNLLDGRAYTATELANCAGISLQSASNHLSKLLKNNILSVAKQGRHRYYKFSSPEVARVIESMASLLSFQKEHQKIKKPKPTNFTYARTCYHHLAGEIGVKITNALIAKEILLLNNETYQISEYGTQWFSNLNIDIQELQKQKRTLAYPCLDWSERKYHLAGALGNAFLEFMLTKNWFRRHKNSRELTLTFEGKKYLKSLLDLDF